MKKILLSAILALTLSFTALAAPQEVCASTNGWEKSGENAVHVTITLTGDQVSWIPDSGWTITGLCWKSGQEVQTEFGSWDSEVIRYSASGQDVSHAAALMEQVPLETPTSIVPTPTATPTDIEPTPTVIDDPTATPTDEPTGEPTSTPAEPTPTVTEDPTGEPTEEPTPEETPTDEPTPTSTPTDDPTPTETDEPTVTPTDEPTTQPTPSTTSTPSLLIPPAGFVEGQEVNGEDLKILKVDFPQLSIPSIGFQEIVTTAPRQGQSWALGYEPSQLEGLENTIGIHNGYAGTGWHRLAELQAGALVVWQSNSYIVRELLTVNPRQIEALRLGDLVLFTCQGANWEERMIIVSERIVIL